MRINLVQGAGAAAAVVSAGVLGFAIWTESALGLVPCALCLWERWPYRVVIGLGVVAAVAGRWRGGVPGRAVLGRAVLGLAALAMLAGAGLGLTHVGVEAQWWPSPLPECAAPELGGGTMAERLARMPARPAKPCDEPTYLVPGLPVSMAGMNLVAALAMFVGLAMCAGREWRLR